MTSELSNALNPNIVQSRQRARTFYSSNVQPVTHQHQFVVEPPQQYIPHRSELELAITELPPPPPPAPAPPPQPLQPQPVQRPPPPPQNVAAVQQLLRLLATTKQTQEAERKRRLEWEQEQEARYTQRTAELEKQVADMKGELTTLRAYVDQHPPASSTASTPAFQPDFDIPPIAELPPEMPPSPISPPSFHPQPQFVQGSSSRPFIIEPSPSPSTLEPLPTPLSTGFPTPNLNSGSTCTPRSEPPEPVSRPPTTAPNPRKRRTPPRYSESEEEWESSDDSDSSPPDHPRKRANGHDSRCLTIHSAMRAHFLRVMKLKTDKKLPDSHDEYVRLPADSPVRFVWDKTPKQSEHNGAMKIRVVADIKERRRLYKHVPDKEFNKKTLEATFDQVFTTLRQKFRAQRDSMAAVNLKKREDHKAMRARRLGRKKTKLANRTETRKKMEAFSHPTFDGALQQECMSSEESCDDYSESSLPSGAQKKLQVLRLRGLPWRSSRLLHFYDTVDEQEKINSSLKPKRGMGRKERCVGLPKDGFRMPPKGIANWMVSRKWIREMQYDHPDLEERLKDIVVDAPGFDWDQFHALGDESAEEPEEPEPYIPRSDASYSLAHALAPV